MEKKIIVKITPAAVLLVLIVLVGAIVLNRGIRREKRPLTIDDTPGAASRKVLRKSSSC